MAGVAKAFGGEGEALCCPSEFDSQTVATFAVVPHFMQ
jgi:hypothetical protein